MTIRVVLVDDQDMVRSGFAALLSAQSDIDVVGEAAETGDPVRRVRPPRLWRAPLPLHLQPRVGRGPDGP